MSQKFNKMAEALEAIKAKAMPKKEKVEEKKAEAVEEKEINADVNGDGVVDEQDVEVVKKKVKKKKAEQAE